MQHVSVINSHGANRVLYISFQARSAEQNSPTEPDVTPPRAISQTAVLLHPSHNNWLTVFTPVI